MRGARILRDRALGLNLVTSVQPDSIDSRGFSAAASLDINGTFVKSASSMSVLDKNGMP